MTAIGAEWNALLAESRADSVFLRFEWTRCWHEALDGRLRPFAIAVRDAQRNLVGLAPFYVATMRLGSLLPFRVLRVCGDEPTGADYPDWIARDKHAEAVLPAIACALAASRDWDLVWMPKMAAFHGACDRLLAACESAGLRAATRPHEFAWFALPRERDAYFRSLSSNKRNQLRSERKRILSQPAVEIRRCEREDEIDTFLDALFELHGLRWRERGEAGSFEQAPRKREFYRRFARVALANGWLSLYGLRAEERFRAIQIGYVYERVYYQLQEGFDPGYRAGAGNVLRARVIEDLIGSGVETYDFLGGMSEHKRRWTSQMRLGADLVIARNTLVNRTFLASGIWPTSRLMPQTAP